MIDLIRYLPIHTELYLFGGFVTELARYTNDLFVYDTATNNWSSFGVQSQVFDVLRDPFIPSNYRFCADFSESALYFQQYWSEFDRLGRFRLSAECAC